MPRNIHSPILDAHDDLNRLLSQTQAVIVALNSEGAMESINSHYVKDALWLVEDLLSEIRRINNHQWDTLKRNS